MNNEADTNGTKKGHLTILTGFDSNKQMFDDYYSYKGTFLGMEYRSPFSEEVCQKIDAMYNVSNANLKDDRLCELYESNDADKVAKLFDPKLEKVRFLNPTCMLNQRAQSCFAGLVCEMVAKGKDVCILTQSSIIFDTVRMCVKKGIISCEDVAIWYYLDDGISKIDMQILPSGAIPYVPRGFFDEEEKIMMELL